MPGSMPKRGSKESSILRGKASLCGSRWKRAPYPAKIGWIAANFPPKPRVLSESENGGGIAMLSVAFCSREVVVGWLTAMAVLAIGTAHGDELKPHPVF